METGGMMSDISEILSNSILFRDEWELSYAERGFLMALLNELKPECSIEIGTLRGGSTSLLSIYSSKVYSIDINPACAAGLKGKFNNVEFLTGDSREHLPELLRRLENENTNIEFVLIDGDHSEDGVYNDMNTFMRFVPNKPLFILLHDSFNPHCRDGMKRVDWAISPYLHFIHLDLISGELCSGSELQQEMWGGFALAVMLPEKRTCPDLTVNENRSFFSAALHHSIYHKSFPGNIIQRLVLKVKRALRAAAGNASMSL